MAAPFHPPKLTQRISGKGQPLTSEGAQLAYPTGFQLDDAKVDACGTKALQGKGKEGIVFLVSDTFLVALPVAPGGVFLLRHGLRLPTFGKETLNIRPHPHRTAWGQTLTLGETAL